MVFSLGKIFTSNNLKHLFCLNFPVFLGGKFCQIFLQEILFGGKILSHSTHFSLLGTVFWPVFYSFDSFKLTFCQLTLNLVWELCFFGHISTNFSVFGQLFYQLSTKISVLGQFFFWPAFYKRNFPIDIKSCLGCWANNESQKRSKENQENKKHG